MFRTFFVHFTLSHAFWITLLLLMMKIDISENILSIVNGLSLITLVFGLIEGEPNSVEIKVIVDGIARLPCNITNQIEDDLVTLILWYKEGTGGHPIYTLDSRTNLDTEGPQIFSHQLLDNRAHFEFNKSSVHGSILTINPIINEDNGNYKCRVDFRRGRTQVTNINLYVIVPPSRINIINGDNGKEIILPNPVSFDENTNINLICRSFGGRPSPSLFWYHDDQLIDNSFDIIDSNTGLVENHLSIINIDKKMLNSILTCEASNNNFTNGPTISLTLDINIKPNSVEITNDRQPISAGRKIEIICVSMGSRPPARVTWFKDDKPMIHSRQSYSTDGLVTTSALILMPTRDDNKVNVICKADNPRLNNSFIQDSWNLEVYYDPKVSLVMGNSTRSALVAVDDRVELYCNVSANPMVFEVQWYRDGEPLIKRKGVRQSNKTLIIEKVKRKDHGRYQCSAMNIEGQTMSNVFHLEVHYPPSCKKGQRGVVGVTLGETVKILCEIEASPEKVEFYWKLNGSSINDNQFESKNLKFTSEDLISKLEYEVKSKDDFAIFECSSRNVIGKQLESCFFTLIPSGPPEALSECSIYERFSDSLFIKCLPGYDGGLNQTFNVQVLDNRKQIVQNITNSFEPSFNISGLTPESAYILMLFSTNSNGSSRIISLATTTRSWREESDLVLYLFDNNIMSAVRLGLISAIILLSLVITIAFGIKRHRQLKPTVIKQSSSISESESFGDNLSSEINYAKPFTSGAINPDVVPSSKDCYIDKVNETLIGNHHYTNYVLPGYNQMLNNNYTIGFTGSQGYGINFIDKKLHTVESFPNFRETINNLQEVNCDNSIILSDLTTRNQLLPRRSFQQTSNLRTHQQRNVHFGTNLNGFSTPV